MQSICGNNPTPCATARSSRHDRDGASRPVRPRQPRIRCDQNAVQIFSKRDIHRVIRRHRRAKFPDTFQERRSGVANQPEPPPDIQSPTRIICRQQPGCGPPTQHTDNFYIHQVRYMNRFGGKQSPGRPVIQQRGDCCRRVEDDHLRSDSNCSTIVAAGMSRSGNVATSAALSARRVAASSSRIATAVTDVLAARAIRSSRFMTSSGTLRRCRVRTLSGYPDRLLSASK